MTIWCLWQLTDTPLRDAEGCPLGAQSVVNSLLQTEMLVQILCDPGAESGEIDRSCFGAQRNPTKIPPAKHANGPFNGV